MKIINLHATWCGPCRFFEPVFEKVSKDDKYKDIEFSRFDIETEDGFALCEKHFVKSVPTTLFLDSEDNLIYKASGAMPIDTFTELIDTYLKKYSKE